MTVDSESKPKDPVICSVTPLSVVEAFKPYSSGIAEAMDGETMNAAANATPILDGRAIPPSACRLVDVPEEKSRFRSRSAIPSGNLPTGAETASDLNVAANLG